MVTVKFVLTNKRQLKEEARPVHLYVDHLDYHIKHPPPTHKKRGGEAQACHIDMT